MKQPMKWIKWWLGTATNPKFALIANDAGSNVTVTDVIALWAVTLEQAADKTHWGVCTRSPEWLSMVLRGPSADQIRHIYEAMDAAGMVKFSDGQDTAPACIEIANWEEYQSHKPADPTGAERQSRYRKRHGNGHDTVTAVTGDGVTVTSDGRVTQDLERDIEQEKQEGANAPKASNGSKKPSKPTTSERGARLSPDWKPSEANVAYAFKCGLTRRDLEREAANFVDYWVSKPGPAGVHLDWDRTWSRWCRTSAEKLGRPTPPTLASDQTNVVPGPRGLPQTDDEWLTLLIAWKSTRSWPIHAGPHPMTAQSKVPRALYPKAGLDSPDGKLVKRGLDPDQQRQLLEGVKSGMVALPPGPEPGQPGSMISAEVAREYGYAV